MRAQYFLLTLFSAVILIIAFISVIAESIFSDLSLNCLVPLPDAWSKSSNFLDFYEELVFQLENEFMVSLDHSDYLDLGLYLTIFGYSLEISMTL